MFFYRSLRKAVFYLTFIFLYQVLVFSQEQTNDYTIEDKYIVFFLTNTSVYQADSLNQGIDANTDYTFVGEIPYLFGEISDTTEYKYAYGLPGPMLLTQSIAQMERQVNKAFDIAEKYNVPVYFQLDDCTNYTTEFGSGAEIKFYDSTAWCEWVDFPQEGEEWGGESNGRLPYWWFNWGSWMHAEAFPSFESPGFKEFIVNRLQEGVLDPLMERYEALEAEGKGYLFAGMAVGWETNIPDYSSYNTLQSISTDNLPVNTLAGDTMQVWEATTYGFNSLNQLGYTSYNQEALFQVIHDYIELLSKTAYDAGVPRSKIFSHIVGLTSSSNYANLKTTAFPPIWTAVNDYCIPGYTMNVESCPYNISTLLSEIQDYDSEQLNFANVEGYSRGYDDTYDEAYEYFESMFDNGAVAVAVFGWGRESSSSTYAVSHSEENPFVMAAKTWINPGSDTASVAEWNFTYENGLDGWELDNNLAGSITDDVMILNIKGSDPYMTSPYGLNLKAEDYNYLVIKMRNRTSDTVGKVYWRTSTETSFASSKNILFTTVPKDSIMREYVVDLGSSSRWYDRIAQIRFDPVDEVTSGKVYIEQIKFVNEITDVEEDDSETVPQDYGLYQNYPNPFNPSTKISYEIPQGGAGHVKLRVYDLLGRLVAELVNEQKNPGNYSVQFNASGLSSGVYYYQLQVNEFSEVKKMLLLK